jgi:large subunit ribosomal protein L9
MASTTILLREDIDELGGRGEIVKVKAGYARNYLLPRGLASLATKGNVKQIEQERGALLKKAAVERTTAEGQKEQMGVIELSFERQAGEHGQLFGSVTSMDVAEALQQKGYEIDRRKIILRQPIKETGDYTVKVKLHRDVLLDVPVHVTAMGVEASAPEETKTEKKTRRGSKKADTGEIESADAAAAAPADETAAE